MELFVEGCLDGISEDFILISSFDLKYCTLFEDTKLRLVIFWPPSDII